MRVLPTESAANSATTPSGRDDGKGLGRRTRLAIAMWVALVAVAAAWGGVLLHLGVRMQIRTPPLTGSLHPRVDVGVLAAVGAAVIGCAGLPLAAQRLRWRTLLALTPPATLLWVGAINLVDGWSAFTRPVHKEYAATAARIVSPHRFLSTFPARILDYNVHTQGHPPGMELILWGVNRLGWHGTGAAATLYITVGCVAGVAALVALRDVAGEERARAAAPFVVIFPAAIWMATSGDAFFAGISAWAVALVVLASGRRGLRADCLAAAGGLLFGVTAFLSYGLVLLAAIPIAVAIRRRRVRPLVIAAVAAGLVFAGFVFAGFWWVTGLRLTHERYYAGVASRRPYRYFLVADLAVLALAVGPAVAAGLAALRDRATGLLVGAAVGAVVLADLSGMSKAEVERIWLPFVPWLLLSTAALTVGVSGRASRRRVRAFLAMQAITAIVIQIFVRSPW